MSEQAIAKKQEEVDKIVNIMEHSKSIVVVNYLGLTVQESTELRKQLREENITFKVIKNTIMRRVMHQMGIDDYHESVFQGPTAVAFSPDDETAPARILKKFSKKDNTLELKGGVIDGKVLSKEEISRIADLPDRDGLLSMLLSVLQAPVRNVAYAVKAVEDKVEEEGPAADNAEEAASEGEDEGTAEEEAQEETESEEGTDQAAEETETSETSEETNTEESTED